MTHGRARMIDNDLTKVVQTHHRDLVRFLIPHTRCRSLAQDIAQQAYSKLLQRDRSTIDSLPEYLWTTARNLAYDLRADQRVREDRAASYANTLEVCQQRDRGPEATVSAQQSVQLIGRAIAELSDKCARAFRLRFIEELEFADIAARMGLKDSMAREYVARAIKHCRDFITAHSGDTQ